MACKYEFNCNKKACNESYCARQYKLECLYHDSLLTEYQSKRVALYPDADGTDLDEFKVLANESTHISNFVNSGKNLYLHSKTPGNGKTSWACRFIQNYFLVSWPKYTFEYPLALFVSVPRYLLALKDNIGSKNEYANFVSNNIMKADLVLFADIAAKVGTDFELNHLLNIINTRLELRKSSIFTTNLDRNELVIALGDRLASRICNSSLDVALHGKDKRNLAVV